MQNINTKTVKLSIDNTETDLKSAFDTFFNNYKNRIYTFILHELNDKNDANDVFQDVCIKIFKHIKKVKDIHLKAWCFKVTINTIHDYRRKKQRFRKIFDFFSGEENNYELDTPYDFDDNNSVREAIRTLPVEQKEIINMHYILGLTYREISEITECSINTITARARYGLKKIKHYLEHKGYE